MNNIIDHRDEKAPTFFHNLSKLMKLQRTQCKNLPQQLLEIILTSVMGPYLLRQSNSFLHTVNCSKTISSVETVYSSKKIY